MTGECPDCGATVEAPGSSDFRILEAITTVEIHPNMPDRLPAADDRKADYPPEGEDELSPRYVVGNRTCPDCGAKLITMEKDMGDPEYGEWNDAEG